ncbi:non-hydrolyzing UDP-N-acetylglucosamine 2-epimerase [Puia dinghuensis]|uniref:UDP-N-acetylglucosamine 2-epimerase (Non-hydrolyzing) n=1 Tax=Puia dinghuensis TaxID=1792502 RepID=A0A8J2UF71_9BACT|nr:UDP-N-acetylglucosamine 2-epimerase (non-hydrolyzing) [Puia dinghuensis]GGB08504.1 UDP-N-acetylglucosamine 2-epimerase (non-hydrolyzing) [Puia dinghuensis]
MMKLLLIAGTRPNFIKLAPLYHRIKNEAPDIRPYICHTGQHFDFNMSDIFWQNLELPSPDFQLNIKGDGVVDTIGKTILGINEIIRKEAFNLVVVFGDVNATAAGAIVGSQSRIPVMHVEAGLRSFDRDMPEEINRVITDHISDYLMVSEPSGIKNLEHEGFPRNKVFMVGNIMIECLLRTRPHWESIPLKGDILSFYEKKPVVATFHRPENVDNPTTLHRMADILQSYSKTQPVVFPVHPRTKARLEQHGLFQRLVDDHNILITQPMSYFEFLRLVSNASLVITDSGGVQEETSFLRIPCVTFRKNTERPVTVELGTNKMMSIFEENYLEKIEEHIAGLRQSPRKDIPLWDDSVSRRILDTIRQAVILQPKTV